MWMLLRQRPRESERAEVSAAVASPEPSAPGEPEASPVASARAESSGTADGRLLGSSILLLTDETAPELLVYIHPGRTAMGTVDLDQAQGQFDWDRARFHESLSAAELAEEGDAGFLVEVRGPLRVGSGAPREHGAFFVSLRGGGGD